MAVLIRLASAALEPRLIRGGRLLKSRATPLR